jgi:tryptophan synthase alpha chain
LFAELKQNGKKALVPFLTAGYPSRKGTLSLMKAAADAGADAIEIGIPFSDPLADGPVIQNASQKALENGIKPADAFRLVRDFRKTHDVPVLFMTYANPVARFGKGTFFRMCRNAGLAGVIIPDLPPEEVDVLDPGRFPMVYLCSPTCSTGRIRKIARKSEPFVYLVSVKGVTGARDQAAPGVAPFVRRVRKVTSKPLYVGFGISRPEHVRSVGRAADGVIIGSAILRRVAEGAGARQVGRYLSLIRKALDRS